MLFNTASEAYTKIDKIKRGRVSVGNVLIIITMIVIGAVIGGVTNSLAIKMLFRPYEPINLGKWKLPFTPGLIPKRREELASQLGKMVVEYLLTPKGLKKKMLEPAFNEQVANWMRTEVIDFMDKKISLRDLLAQAEFHFEEHKMKEKLNRWSVGRYEKWLSKNGEKKIQQFIHGTWQDKTISTGKELSNHIQQQLVTFAKSREATEKIESLLDNFIENRGFMANMISSFMGNEEIARKIQPIAIEYLEADEMNQWLREMISRELSVMLNQTLFEAESKIGKKDIHEGINDLLDKHVQLDVWLNRPVTEWLEPYRAEILDNMIPKLTDFTSRALAARVDTLMENLHLSDIVEKEVASFPIKRIEDLLLDISRKEFKMITYLGILLGGLIGLFQGIIVLLLS